MKSVAILLVLTASTFMLTGCRGVPTPGERQARHDLDRVGAQYQPGNNHPQLPELTPDSSLSNFLAFALFNSPVVKTAFYDWSASVENITLARSLPDPQLTFQAYVQNTLISLMPGFAWNFPGRGKREVRAGVAAAESEGKYFVFKDAALQTAFDLKKSYYNLELLGEQLRLNHELLALLDNLQGAIRAQNETGQATLAGMLGVQGDRDRLRADIENLADSRGLLLNNFKAALGLTPSQPDPPTPAHFEMSLENPDTGELLRIAFAHNPQLKTMEADVRAAEGGIAAAYKERMPDFSAGISAEVYKPPFFWPQASMTLPVWRDKLAAEIARAKAGELAAKTRLQAAQINLAVSFAEKAFACHETSRELALVEGKLIPQARQSLAIVRAGYRDGTMNFSSLIGAERMPLDLQLTAAQARAAHEIALAELTIAVAGLPPAGLPVLSAAPQP